MQYKISDPSPKKFQFVRFFSHFNFAHLSPEFVFWGPNWDRIRNLILKSAAEQILLRYFLQFFKPIKLDLCVGTIWTRSKIVCNIRNQRPKETLLRNFLRLRTPIQF